jgi:hypothetical protein
LIRVADEPVLDGLRLQIGSTVLHQEGLPVDLSQEAQIMDHEE